LHGDFVTHREVEEQIGGEILAAARRQLYHFMFGSQQSIRIETALCEGDPAEEVLKWAERHDTDLIVAGSRGLSQVRGWLYNSVSRRLVHAAPCSVLIVRGLPSSLPVVPG
jgi:nucleotide-binding universal stress UspA family protein